MEEEEKKCIRREVERTRMKQGEIVSRGEKEADEAEGMIEMERKG